MVSRLGDNPTEPLSTSFNPAAEDLRCRCLHRMFPCSYSVCCPCLPQSMTKVQDWLHGVLLCGVLASMGCIVEMIYELAWGSDCMSPLCFKQWISGVIVLPSTVYFMRTIGNYDEQLRERKRRHQEEVDNLITNINAQVAEMNELCRNLLENANEFAMGRFNDKSEYFQKFLKGVKAHYRDLYIDDKMLEELKQFVIHWLRNFSGCFVNPEASPLMKNLEQDLHEKTTPQQVCDVAIQRLQASSVVFSFQVPAAVPLLRHPSHQLSLGSSSSLTASEVEQGTSQAMQAGSPEGKCGASWLRLSRCQRCSCTWSSNPDRMPVRVSLGFLQMRILSRVHANLMVCLLCDIALLAFEMFSDRWTAFLLVSVNAVCIVSVLACFEQINEIAMLEQQIHVFERRSQEVGQRRDEAKRNWEKVQQLHDLWLYRTLPCLSIMGKIHNHLSDEDMAVRERLNDSANEEDTAKRARLRDRVKAEDKRPEFLKLVNESLDVLEAKLGPLHLWSKGGPLTDEWKQSIGKQLKSCEKCENVEELVSRLPIITSDLSALDDAPPPTSSCAAFQSSPSSPPGSPRSRESGSFISKNLNT